MMPLNISAINHSPHPRSTNSQTQANPPSPFSARNYQSERKIKMERELDKQLSKSITLNYNLLPLCFPSITFISVLTLKMERVGLINSLVYRAWVR